MPKCAFCGKQLMKGSGLLFVRKDGSAQFFCSGKCQKNTIQLKRSPYSVKWTEFYQKEKQAEKRLSEKRGTETEKKAGKNRKKKKKR